MKRLLILCMVLGLVSASVATAGAKGTKRATRVERTVEAPYGPYPSPVMGCKEPGGTFACLTIQTRSQESFLTAKVTDLHGQPVLAWVESRGNRPITFCGETTEPIRFTPGAELKVYVADPLSPTSDEALDCPTNRVKTTGTISVTLSNVP